MIARCVSCLAAAALVFLCGHMVGTLLADLDRLRTTARSQSTEIQELQLEIWTGHRETLSSKLAKSFRDCEVCERALEDCRERLLARGR